MDIDDVRRKGLHDTLTWIVEDTAGVCDAIHAEFLAPSIELLRARVAGTLDPSAWTQARREARAGAQIQGQSPDAP